MSGTLNYSEQMREFLRSLPVFSGVIAHFDTTVLPDHPAQLFEQWLRNAAEEGVNEPHAMTLSTTDARGCPDARVLILKDLDERGWWFATNSASAKGIQLTTQPMASLTFYWPAVGRQVRVRGSVVPGSPQHNAQDFQRDPLVHAQLRWPVTKVNHSLIRPPA